MPVSMSRGTIEVAHVVIESSKPFAEARKALEASIPALDAEIGVLLGDGLTDRLRQRLESGAELSIFLTFNHGALLRLYGQDRQAMQYLIGNPLTASKMTRYNVAAALYAPLRVVLYETDSGSRFEYDLPSSLFGQFGDERITEVARGLDVSLGRALSAAAG